jgi:CRP-like cAMP-binding protein
LEPEASRSPLLSGASPVECAQIIASARPKEFTRRQVLFVKGDIVKQVFLLRAGSVKINTLGPCGSEVILGLGVPGDVLGAVGLLSTGRHDTTAQAFRPCSALTWEAPAFRSLMQRFPILHHNLTQILAGDLAELKERFSEVATQRVAPRVASQLVRLMDKIGRLVDGEVEVGVSREDLAQMTGTTLFTVSRLFSAWEALGMVTPRREAVSICDVVSLRGVTE